MEIDCHSKSFLSISMYSNYFYPFLVLMDKPPILFDKSLILRHIPLFSGLNFFERKLILNSLEVVEYKKSEIIYREGDPPDAIYCIISGRVEVFTERAGHEEVLEYITRGKYFGFISLLTGEPHSVSARAVNDTVIARIPTQSFGVILKNIPRLAIDLSQMLSRRLKRKDLHPKSIFESTIIAVYGAGPMNAEASLYALNLSLGLRKETQKKVVFVLACADDPFVCDLVKIPPDVGFSATGRFFRSEDVSKNIFHHDKGIDVLRIPCAPDRKPEASFLISLVTMLINDYHFCVVHLPPELGAEAFKMLAQSDTVHLLLNPDAGFIKKARSELESSGVLDDKEVRKKIKLLVVEDPVFHGKGPQLSLEEEASLFHQPIYATLPSSREGRMSLMAQDDKDPYCKTIRRISRQVGEVLVGIALGSGSAMGMAQVGVLKVLEEENIPVDIVAGCSIGAFIGALWCCGYSAKEVEAIILANNKRKYLFGLDDLTFPLHGLIRGKHIQTFLKRYLGEKTFYEIKRPFKVVACDCMSMRQVIFDSGRLLDAVMASISIPGVFVPYKIAGRYYIDGGILNPLPTDVLVEAGAKKILAVNVLPSGDEIERTYELMKDKEAEALKKPFFFKKLKEAYFKKKACMMQPNIFDVIISSVQSFEYSLAQLSGLSQADVMLHPDMVDVSWSAFERAKELIQRGEEETRSRLPEIRDLIRSNI